VQRKPGKRDCIGSPRNNFSEDTIKADRTALSVFKRDLEKRSLHFLNRGDG